MAGEWPLTIKSLGTDAGLLANDPAEVTLLGHAGPLKFHRDARALVVELPEKKPCDHAYVLTVVKA